MFEGLFDSKEIGATEGFSGLPWSVFEMKFERVLCMVTRKGLFKYYGLVKRNFKSAKIFSMK
jgi:hypothetical protein